MCGFVTKKIHQQIFGCLSQRADGQTQISHLNIKYIRTYIHVRTYVYIFIEKYWDNTGTVAYHTVVEVNSTNVEYFYRSYFF